MNPLQERIERMRKMASDDPDNELGHFSLGKLYAEAGQFDEAIKSYCRTIELSPQFSKAYELLGDALVKVGRVDEAAEILTNGWKIADERGDRVPREAMGKQLQALGKPVPQATAAQTAAGPGTGFHCQRPMCSAGNRAEALARPPLPDAMGERIAQTICSACWNEWFRNYSIKVINELRIDLSTEFGQEEYDKHMRGFLGFEEETALTS